MTAPALVQPSAADEAHDRAVIAGYYGNCASFSPSGCVSMPVSATPDGSGGMLYAVLLPQQFGDGYDRGAVFFFRGTTLLTGTSSLAPGQPSAHGPGLSWVQTVSTPATGEFAVAYAVSSQPNACNACVGTAGTDTYVYGWDGSAMTVVSGHAPTPPKVIGEG